MIDSKHPSHKTRFSWDASTYDEICVNCGATDQVPGGWGKLVLPCPTKEGQDQNNQERRVALIDRKFKGELSPTEDAELDELQAEHGAYLDAIQPPPFDKLEELEAIARRKQQ